MFLHCFPIIPVTSKQCDTKIQIFHIFYQHKNGLQSSSLFTHTKKGREFSLPFCFFFYINTFPFPAPESMPEAETNSE